MTLHRYYNRFTPNQHYSKALFLAGKGLQSAELNEIQDYMLSVCQGLGDALFQEGSIIKGAACIVNSDKGEVTLEAGRLYVKGAIRDIVACDFKVPLTGSVVIGVSYEEKTMTELEDPNLRDPAQGTRNYQEPGAARLQILLTWRYVAEGTSFKETGRNGAFFPVYTIENGVLIQHAPPPEYQGVHHALARYDRESHGSYVTSGLEVRYLSSNAGVQTFMVTEGKAHVEGYEIELPHSQRVVLPEEPDIEHVYSDPYSFQADKKGVMELRLHATPLHEVTRVDVTLQKTVSLTHGAFTGVRDPLPDKAVQKIIRIIQGTVLYEEGKDFRFTASEVDWSLPGAEPAPSSTYSVTYLMRGKITPTHITDAGFTLKGAVEESLVSVDYSWYMPRFDVIALSAQGKIERIKGQAHPWRPVVPKTPPSYMALASIYQSWRKEQKPRVDSLVTRVVPMQDLEAMRSSIHNLYDLLAQERLKNDVNARDPSSKKGVFVDPFFDDDMRDQGLPQNAAIVDRALILPIQAQIIDMGKGEKPWMLPYVLEPVLEQLAQTGDMKINPYQAFAPIPAQVTITLNIDRWTELETVWSSPMTQRFSVQSSPITHHRVNGGGFARTQSVSTQNVLLSTTTTESNELLFSQSEERAFMRQMTQTFTLEGFTPGEQLRMVFDGLEITPETPEAHS